MATTSKTKARATTAKRSGKKPTTVKRITPKKRVAAAAPAESSFFEARFTNQSLYWLLFGVTAIVFVLWLFMLDARVRDLYDQIEESSYSNMEVVPSTQPAPTE